MLRRVRKRFRARGRRPSKFKDRGSKIVGWSTRSSIPNPQSSMPFASIEQAIEDFRAGRLVIIVDDEDRENEGDLACAAERVTPEIINFMAKFGRGLICLPMTPERPDELQIPL